MEKKVYAEEAAEKAAKKAIEKNARETALRMLKRGRLSVEEIAEYSELTIEEVTELQKDLQS